MTAERPTLRTAASWVLVAKIIGFAISFVIPLAIARALDPEAFGLYRMSFQLVSTTTGLSTLYFGLTAYYYLARDPASRAPAILNILVLYGVVGSLVLLIVSAFPQLLGTIFESGGLVPLAPLVAIVFALSLFALFLEVITAANQEPVHCAAAIVGGSLVRAVFMLGAVAAWGTVESLLLAAIVASVLQCIALVAYTRSRFPTLFERFSPSLFRDQFRYQLPYGLTSLFLLLQTDAHHYFVANHFGEAQFGAYSVGFALLPMLMIAREAVGLTMVPRVSELQQHEQTGEIWRITTRAIEKLALIYLPTVVFLWLTADWVLTALYTEKFANSAPVFQISLLLLLAHMVIVDPIARAYKELGRVLLIVTIATSVCIVLLLVLLADSLSLRGIALVVVVPQLIQTAVIAFVAARRINVKRQDLAALTPVLKILAAALCCALPAWLVLLLFSDYLEVWNMDQTLASLVGLSVVGCVFSACYLAIAVYWRLFDAHDTAQIRAIARRILGKN
ncbi:MAG TPA: oligosaccharide flippase family protein [Steroidobacteraceae bacterium]|nr:oligosaccharide flippase family protein [Steroidobacteraceae bacterium]HRX90256.1 oligosaccharide flippase family protein [Steroidobacteraceae bacterium]